MFIRNFKQSDIDDISKLFENELGYHISIKDLTERITEMMNAGKYKIFVAVDNHQVVGFIGIETSLVFEIKGKIMRIIALAVAHDVQRKGIGKQLIEQAKIYAKSHDIAVMTLNSELQRTGAHLFYERQGFYKKGYSFFYKIDNL